MSYCKLSLDKNIIIITVYANILQNISKYPQIHNLTKLSFRYKFIYLCHYY